MARGRRTPEESAGASVAEEIAGRPSAFEAAAVALWHEDLSEVKRALEALRAQSVTDLGGYLADRPEQVAALARLVRVRDVNPCCVRLHDAPSRQVLIEGVARTFVSETLEALGEALVAMFEGRRDFQARTRVRTLRGRRLDVVVSLRFPPPDASFEHVYVSTLDVTREARAEAEREIVAARLEQALEAAPMGIVIADRRGRVEHANPALCRMLRYARGELVGKSWRDLTHPDDVQASAAVVRRLARGGAGPERMLKRYVRKDGTTIWGRIHLSRLRLPAGGPVRLLGFVDDVTALREAEERQARLDARMRRANRLESLGALAGGVAHDFNNLLVGVLGHAGIAKGRVDPDSAVHRDLEGIEAAARKAAELTDQMLAYSGGGRFVLQPLRLATLVRKLRGLLEVALPAGATLEIAVDAEEPLVRLDAPQLRQLVLNLVTNAAEALPPAGGRVRVRTGAVEADAALLARTYVDDGLAPGRYALLEVEDDGAGIAPEDRERVFDPFFTTKAMGRGLGLAAALGIVRGHAGGIRIDSRPGHGTTVRVLLPADTGEDAEAPRGDPAAAPPADACATVLLADDKQVVRDVAREMLEQAGHRVVLARDGAEAVERFAEGGIDLVVLDLTMPRMDGTEALRRIRALAPEVPVILSSGYAEEAVLGDLGGTARPGFVQKPYRPAELLAAVSAALGGG